MADKSSSHLNWPISLDNSDGPKKSKTNNWNVGIAILGGIAGAFVLFKLFFSPKNKSASRSTSSNGSTDDADDVYALSNTSSNTSRSGEGTSTDRPRGCAAFIEPHKIKTTFVIVMDPLQNNQTKLAKLVQSMYENAQCPAALSVAIVTSTVAETQRKVEQLAPIQNLPNIALKYVEVYHPCSVDQAVSAAIQHAYSGEEFICTLRPVISLTKDWDASALKQFYAVCPAYAATTASQASLTMHEKKTPHVVLTGVSHHRNHATFPAFSGWAQTRKSIFTPTFRWVRYATPPEVSQPSMVFTSAFSFAPAQTWIHDAAPDMHLEALTPTISDWLYSCRLHSIAYMMYAPAQPLAVVQADVSPVQNTGGCDRLVQWFSTPHFLDATAETTGIDNFAVEAEWRSHTGLLDVSDEDEILYKYGTLAAAERSMKTIRTQLS